MWVMTSVETLGYSRDVPPGHGLTSDLSRVFEVTPGVGRAARNPLVSAGEKAEGQAAGISHGRRWKGPGPPQIA